jgi:hypothetical protein
MWTSEVWVWQMCVCEGDTRARVRRMVGHASTWPACHQGHLDVAKYLCERGGERLLMLTMNVSAVHMLCLASQLGFCNH